MSKKPDYKDYNDEPCDQCGYHARWWEYYTEYCDHCGYQHTNEEAMMGDYRDIKAERDFIWNEAGGNDDPLRN